MVASILALALPGCDPTGSCESVQKNDATNGFCLDNSKKSECDKPSPTSNHSFDSRTCAERGYKKCGALPMMMKSCPDLPAGSAAPR